jgi:hypothetical protein
MEWAQISGRLTATICRWSSLCTDQWRKVPILKEHIMNIYFGLVGSGGPSMPEIAAASPDPACYHLFPGSRIQEFQLLAPDPFSPRGRDARGRFAKGNSGNPRGRPRGIRNPRRRVPDLVARRPSAQALSDLLDRKPRLLRRLTAQVLPPPLATIDPAERLGIDLVSSRTTEDYRQMLSKVLAAVARGSAP